MVATPFRPRICFVVSTPGTAATFLNPHIQVLSEYFDVSVIANVDRGSHQISTIAEVIHVPIERSVNIRRDLSALWNLRDQLRAGKFDIIHSVTPKAGLLTAMASAGLRVPNRLHWFTGQVWVTKTGWKRKALKMLDRFIAWRSTLILIDSPSQRSFLIEEGVVSRQSSLVLGSGSICGVDTERFRPDTAARESVRARLNIPIDAQVIIFVGRLNREKGVYELAEAFESVSDPHNTHLVLVGPDEEGLVDRVCAKYPDSLSRIHFVDTVDNPEIYLAAADLFCLPSYREGFGLSAIEAAASQLPAVVTEIYGLTDAVVNEQTGILVPPKDPLALTRAFARLLEDPNLRTMMGITGRRHVIERFKSRFLTGSLLQLNLALMQQSR